MTNAEYIMQFLSPLGIREEMVLTAYEGVDPSAEYSVGDVLVGKALVRALEIVMFLPKPKSVSESGFSISYDFAELPKLYILMCNTYGVKPKDEILSMAGINRITDRTSRW